MRRYYRNAVSGGTSANRLIYESKHPDSILINIAGRNPGYQKGEKITYQNLAKDVKFSGDIWYIYQGSTSFNLYIKNANGQSLNGTLGGKVYMYGQVPVPASPTASSGTGSAADGLHAEEEAETIVTGEGRVISGETQVEPDIEPDVVIAPAKEASLMPAGMDIKKIGIFAAIGIAGLWLLKKMKK